MKRRKLVPNAGRVLRHSWTSHILIIGGLLTAGEAALPYLYGSEPIPPAVFPFVAFVVGIAPPQVGISWRLFVASARDYLPSTVFINPEVDLIGAVSVLGEEGCLSIPGWRSSKVPRHEKVRVNYRDMNGVVRTEEHEGIAARIIQHELDHLNGRLFIDLDEHPIADNPPRCRARIAMAEMERRLLGEAPSDV